MIFSENMTFLSIFPISNLSHFPYFLERIVSRYDTFSITENVKKSLKIVVNFQY